MDFFGTIGKIHIAKGVKIHNGGDFFFTVFKKPNKTQPILFFFICRIIQYYTLGL